MNDKAILLAFVFVIGVITGGILSDCSPSNADSDIQISEFDTIDNIIFSPIDGVVTSVDGNVITIASGYFGSGVYVSPIDGVVKSIDRYDIGNYSYVNLDILGDGGFPIIIVRDDVNDAPIKTYVNSGDVVKIGDELGCVYMGAEVFIYIPKSDDESYIVITHVGQRVVAGETVIVARG